MGQGTRHQEGDLRDEETQHRSHQNPHEILLLHPLLRHDEGQEPEEHARPDRTHEEQGDGRKQPAARQVLAHDDVDAEYGVGHEARQMALQHSVLIDIEFLIHGCKIKAFRFLTQIYPEKIILQILPVSPSRHILCHPWLNPDITIPDRVQ